MIAKANNLQSIGYSDWFKDQVENEKQKNHGIARVASVQKDSYTITNGGKDIFAELSGNLLYASSSASDLPTVGDWVYADTFDDDTHAIIYGLLSRKTLLKRKTVGKLVDFQLIASNIDTAFIIQSLNENFNLRRFERYLVMVNDGGIEPIILLSKCDLVSTEKADEIRESIAEIAPQTKVIAFSNLSQENIKSISSCLQVGSTYCLLGSSGVGKTTLLNKLLGKDSFETQSVSKVQSKGKHTTTSRQLVKLESGAIIIDTPGMRELGSMSLNEGIDETFSEIIQLAQNCKFTNCSHQNEKGCAIQNEIQIGNLSEKRYQNFLKMKKESEFNQMSFIERKKNDKNRGKLIKSVLKSKRR